MPDNKTTIDLETGSLMLTHTGFLKKVVRFISVIIAIFHFYAAGFGAFSAMNQRSLHWLMLTCLAFLYYPATKKQKKISIFDYLFFGLALASGLYILLNWQTIIITRSGAASPTDIAFGIIAVIVVLEAARRTIGPVLPITALIFLAYTFIGPYLPMSVGHMGYSLSRLIAILYMSTEGIFGVAIGVSSSFIIMFVMFGGALKALGGGQFFIDLAYSVTGRLRGGPAKTAVISSALMGSVSGSPIANVVTTGSFTIPLMKHVGYKPHVAGAIESVASTGGQIMPPIMGAAAFIMAEFTLRPYFEIAWAALIPALLYYFAIYLVVDLESVKSGLKGLNKEDLPDLKETIIGGWFYAIPLGILIYLLMSGYSPTMSAFYTILLLYLVSCFKHKSLKKSFSLILDSFEEGVQNAIPVVAACAASGIVVGVISLTGLGLRIIGLVEVLSGGSMLIGLVFMMIASLIMGMGMPTTALYIVLATLSAPALVRLGVPLLTAHLFVFYFGCISTITPPVALTAYAASGIAKANPSTIGWTAFKYGIVAYIIPYMMVYGPALLLEGTTGEILQAALTAAIGVVALTMSIQGIMLASKRIDISIPGRLMLFASALLLIDVGGRTDIIGIALFIMVIALELFVKRLKQQRGQTSVNDINNSSSN